MLGAIYGDIIGSVYEYQNIKTKTFKLFSHAEEFTEDTVLAVAVADTLMKCENVSNKNLYQNTLAQTLRRYGREYPCVGYDLPFMRWLYNDSAKSYKGIGNDCAIRAIPIGWYGKNMKETLALAKATAEITHGPAGIKGAMVTAGALYHAKKKHSKETIRNFVNRYYTIDFTLESLSPDYRFHTDCEQTVPQAIQAFLESTGFEDAIRNAVSLGGDSDTIAAIAGALAEAYYGMSDEEKQKALSYLDIGLRRVTENFYERRAA